MLVQQLAVMLSVLPLALGWVPCAQPPRVAQPVTSATPLRAARAGEVQMGVPKFFRWLTERFPQIKSAPLSLSPTAKLERGIRKTRR